MRPRREICIMAEAVQGSNTGRDLERRDTAIGL